MKSIRQTCIFTIVSNNYLHFANTLFESVKELHPEVDLVLGLCDEVADATHCPDARVIPVRDLHIPNLSFFIYQYSILELNTAIKPYIFDQLINEGYQKIIYFDPDIKIFSSLEFMIALLEEFNVLLTPHLTQPISDNKSPNELDILRAGTYNLGYLGLRSNNETRRLLEWWKNRLYSNCVVDLRQGLFVDQKWMDLAPSLFSGVHIVRQEGWNVAYWNIAQRRIEKINGEYVVNGSPLVFFHYSGFSTQGTTLSKHQNRHTKYSEGTALTELCDLYANCLTNQGISKFADVPYAFAYFADGTAVPDPARIVIRENPEMFEHIDFFDSEQVPILVKHFNSRSPVAKHAPVNITNLMEALWRTRTDLQSAFSDIGNRDAPRYLAWVIANGKKEANFDDVFIDVSRSSSGPTDTPERGKLGFTSGKSLMSGLIRFIWQRRELIPLSWRLGLGESVANWAISTSYPPEKTDSRSKLLPNGLNLIGYMQAESGVGEAARSTLRALEANGIPHCVIDYRLGNISRMEDPNTSKFSDKIQYEVNLLHINADQIKIAMDHIEPNIGKARYNIGYWYWEMPTFPEKFMFAYDQVDEIWVASEFVRDAIAAKTKKPVNIVPPNIPVAASLANCNTFTDLPDDRFIFFNMCDVLSMPERKNPIGVIEAYLAAFPLESESQSKLILKISNLEHNVEFRIKLYSLIEPRSDISLLEGYLSRAKLEQIMARIDCYVSLHRSEGFGLPIAEAMAHAKPVIATNWSGNVDFMNKENSLPVKYQLVCLERDIGPYLKGELWAEPDLDDAANKMALVYKNRKLAKDIGETAQRYIYENYRPENTAKLMRNRLDSIFQQLNY